MGDTDLDREKKIMTNEYIRREDAVEETLKYIISSGVSNQSTWNECVRTITDTLQDMLPADVVPYSIDPDGTLTVTVPKGTKRIGRILIEEDGTRYGGLFYPDTGGCFLSSMEGE